MESRLDLEMQLEALLFVSDTPLSVSQLAELTGEFESKVQDALIGLGQRYDHGHAFQLVRIANGYQMSTKPEFASLVANLIAPQRTRMSRAQLETLSIIAYQQPVTAAHIEAVRGVQSDHCLRALTDRFLIEEVGRKQTAGRPVLYGTTDQFLHQFGLESLEKLPKIEALETASPALELVESTP